MKKWMVGMALAGIVGGVDLGAARAATVLKVDIAESVRLSEWVVRAKVLSLTPVDLRDQGDSIYTDVALSVGAVYRGKGVPATVVMRLMGGTGKDGLALAVPGMPRFAVGDEAVLFLERVGDGFVPCGLEQGVWRIAPSVGNVPVVYRNLGDLAIMTKTADGKLVPLQPTRQGVKPLADLVKEIAAVPN